ncbi:hypothetical protein EON63_12045 [archaeon]|nr:MAG: hypothetical protein EON63_12045 [archaeon]
MYKCGTFVDLCMGPHLPHSQRIKAFACNKTSSTNWLGNVANDPLQRIYAVAFPDKCESRYTTYHIPYTTYYIPYTIYHIPYAIHHIPYTIYHAPCSDAEEVERFPGASEGERPQGAR